MPQVTAFPDLDFPQLQHGKLKNGIEVVLAYVHVFPRAGMLVILLILSLVKAALIVSYFMHLRFEKASLVLSLVPAVVVVIALLFMFFPDSFRLNELRAG